MTKRGRPTGQKPSTAYDYRRSIVLTQILAMMDGEQRDEAIHALVDEWLPRVYHRGPNHLGTDYLLKLLAQHALEYARGGGVSDGKASSSTTTRD